MEKEEFITEDIPFEIPEYKIIESYDSYQLTNVVNQHIALGFEIIGAPFVVTRYSFENQWDNGVQKYIDREKRVVTWAQAMIKKTRSPFSRTYKVTKQTTNPF